MKLAELIRDLGEYEILQGETDLEIKGVVYDSRRVEPGFLFVAVKGSELDGHAFLEDAAGRGAAALVVEDVDGFKRGATLIRVPGSREAMARIAAAFYGYPYEGIEIVGITGTNGKTSTSYILESILKASGARPGVIGTINYRYDRVSRPAPVTTPESLELMAVIREMADNGVTHVVMEVSSHALDQGRVRACPISVPVFTNFSRDHLDYHGDMEGYFQAKTRLFKGPEHGGFSGTGPAVVNADDPRGRRTASLCRRRVLSYGLDSPAQVTLQDLSMDRDGIRGTLVSPRGTCGLRSALIGRINAYNILAASTAALALGIEPGAVCRGVEELQLIPGRLERVRNRKGLSIFVDYAHTPDALHKALETLRPLVVGRLITVFGCGGDRDKGKRPEMGHTAGRLSDLVVVTTDNPRREDPLEIIRQIEEGVRAAGLRLMGDENPVEPSSKGYIVEPDRRKAIVKAVRAAGTQDLILIAGKGHEDYQIVGTDKRHFDDREEAAVAAEAPLGGDA